MRILVFGTSAHGSTPWLGDNAVLKAIDVFRRIESMPFTLESSELFDRPSVNLGRIVGGDAPNKVPEECAMDVDIRYLPEQDPGELLAQIRAIPDVHVARSFIWPPARVSPTNPYVLALCAGRVPAHRRRVDERRPRRRLGRGGVPEGRRARRSSSARPAAATTAPTSGSRSTRWPATGARWSTSRAACPSASREAAELRAVEGGLA